MTGSYDVIVVGAGPSGSYAAMRLAERGHTVLLLDRSPRPRCKIVCTGIVGTEAFRGLALPDAPARAWVRRARFVSPSGVEVLYEPAEPLARVVDRTALDATLAERAVGAGVRLERGLEAYDVHSDAEGVELVCRGDGCRRFRARALVVATGHQRRLHARLGLGEAPAYVHGVHVDLPFERLDAAELYFGNHVAPGFFAWAVPFEPGVARLGVLARQGGRRLLQHFLSSPAIRDRLGIDPESESGLLRGRPTSRGIVQGAVTPTVANRALAVGEAAGQVKTTTAGGIYYGMLGADVAAEVLSEGLVRDRLDTAWLGRYERAWRRRLKSELDFGLELQHVARRLSDPEIDELFRALRDGLGGALRRVVRFDWHRPALQLLFRHSRVLRRAAAVGALRKAS